jgi:hypothetical protein
MGAAQAAPVDPASAPLASTAAGERVAAGADLAVSAQRKAKKKKTTKRRAARSGSMNRGRNNANSPSQKGTGGREPGTGTPPVNNN